MRTGWQCANRVAVCEQGGNIEHEQGQGRSQDFIKGGAQPSLTNQTISLACRMYCAHITGNLKYF